MVVILYLMVKVVAFGWMVNTMFLVFTVVDAGGERKGKTSLVSSCRSTRLLMESALR